MPKVGDVLLPLGLLVLGSMLAPVEGNAQTDTRLIAAVREAREGSSDSARIAVQRILATTPANDSLYPQVLYTAGILANDAADMRRRLQQVAIEFPTSHWAGDALIRLAQLDYAARELEGAAQYLERFAVSFSGSRQFPQAAYWAGRTYFDLKKEADACRWLANGLARAGDDIETKAQLVSLQQRCQQPASTTPAPAPVSAPPESVAPPVTPATPAPAPSSSSRFRIQIAAVGTADAARAAVRKAQSLGYPAVTVQEGSLYKVRAGDFTTRENAQRATTTLKNAFGGNPFVVSGP